MSFLKMSYEAKKDTLIIDVDTQYDFMDPEGSLYVKDAIEIIDNLKKILTYAKENNWYILSTLDTHTHDDPEFRHYGFPPHCVKGTQGHKKIKDTLFKNTLLVDIDGEIDLDNITQYQQILLEKSTFDPSDNPAFSKILKRLSPSMVFIVGVALDYCVKAAALSSKKILGENSYVTVIQDCTKAVDPGKIEEIINSLTERGIRLAKTKDIIH